MIAKLQDVSIRFGRRWVLARLSLEIPAGRTVLLTGANGAGKTTLLRVLSTALRPTRGELTLFGLPTKQNLESVRASIGLVTHASHIYEDMSALENLRLVKRLTVGNRENLNDILDKVGLTPHAHRSVRTFSAGMKRRLCLARALVRDCNLVLLDEPFSALDPQGVQLVEDVIADLAARGKTVVVSTHDIERGLRVCNSHLKLAHGQLAAPLEVIR